MASQETALKQQMKDFIMVYNVLIYRLMEKLFSDIAGKTHGQNLVSNEKPYEETITSVKATQKLIPIFFCLMVQL